MQRAVPLEEISVEIGKQHRHRHNSVFLEEQVEFDLPKGSSFSAVLNLAICS